MDNKEQKEENVKKQNEVESNKKDTVKMNEDVNKKAENAKASEVGNKKDNSGKEKKAENEKNKSKKENKDKKDKKSKKEKKAKKQKKAKKDKKPNKFIETIKKKWLINGTKTLILVLIILAIFFGINLGMQKAEITPLDFSKEKLFTLTQASKDKVKDIQKDINLYFVEYSDDDSTLDLAKQYSKVNEHIKVEAVKANDRPDLVQKYGIESGTTAIIAECGEKYKILSSQDLVTYDTKTYESISIAEERLTSTIQTVSTDEIPKVYFLSGYSKLSLNSGLQYFNAYLENEIYAVETVDVLTTGKIPDDCDTLVVTMPSQDFDEIATNAIIDYINSGKNILWFQAATAQNIEMPNINKILGMYGLNPFSLGIIREADTSKMLSQQPDLILPEIQSTDVTKKLVNSEGVIFVNATKINVMDSDKLKELNVEEIPLLTTSTKSYFRTNFANSQDSAESDDEVNSFTVGAMMTKTLSEANEENGEKAKTSKLIIYGENYFISDMSLTSSSQAPVIQYRQNKDLALNSISYLVDREEDITARKSTGTVTYTATETENRTLLAIIFIVPLVIIIAGVVVWIVRKRKK